MSGMCKIIGLPLFLPWSALRASGIGPPVQVQVTKQFHKRIWIRRPALLNPSLFDHPKTRDLRISRVHLLPLLSLL